MISVHVCIMTVAAFRQVFINRNSTVYVSCSETASSMGIQRVFNDGKARCAVVKVTRVCYNEHTSREGTVI